MSGNAPRLVEGQPELAAIAIPLEAQLGVVGVVLDNLLLVEPAAVPVLKLLREIPAVCQR
jgi:hypothetical protein